MLNRLRARLRNRRFNDDLAEELRFHEAMKQREFESSGMQGAEARAAARRALGNVTLMREQSRRVWIAPRMESVLQDARYAARTLLRQPLHSITTIVILVFGIGLTATIFSMFKAMVLEPWPVKDPASIVRLWARTNGRPVGPTVNEFRFMREQVRSMSGLVAHSSPGYPARLQLPGQAQVSLPAMWVTANFFDVMGVRPRLGAGFMPDDDRAGNLRGPLVISDTAWRVHFQRDPAVVGRQVRVGSQPFTVVGVLPSSFDGLGREAHLWMPLSAMSVARPGDVAWDGKGADLCCINVVGRLAAGTDRAQARQELQLLHERFAAAGGRPTGRIEFFGTSGWTSPGSKGLPIFAAFAAAIALILALACANVGNLQLARAFVRRREIATRISIGASRGRIIRQLLTEGLVISIVAGALAVATAALLPGLIFAIVDDEIPEYVARRLVPDLEVVAFTLFICAVASIAFALAPALQATRMTIPLGALDRASTRASRFPLRSLMLATQIAACTALLAGAGLLTRAIVHAMSFDPGYAVQGVDVITPSFPSGTPIKEREAFMAATLVALESSQGAPAAVTEMDPMSSQSFVMYLTHPAGGNRPSESVLLRRVSPSYFAVLGIPLVRGRLHTSSPSAVEAVVNEAFVRAYWPDGDAIGKAVIQTSPNATGKVPYTVVGVVKDAHVAGLRDIEPVIFTAARQGMFVTRGGPSAAARLMAAANSVNRSVRLQVQPLTASIRRSLSDSMVGAAFAWGLGLLGLALATVGVFGVFAYSVEERRREIGVRLTLGAARRDIVRMLVMTSGHAMAAGLIVGLLLSLACGPLLRNYLFGLSPLDPPAYLLVAILLTCAGTIATVIPAWRACRIDPALTLRSE